jgi:hypothetical protein
MQVTEPDFTQCQYQIPIRAVTGNHGKKGRCPSDKARILVTSQLRKDGSEYKGKPDSMTMCCSCFLVFISAFPSGRATGFRIEVI